MRTADDDTVMKASNNVVQSPTLATRQDLANATFNLTSQRSVNFEDSMEGSVELNDSGFYVSNSSANVGSPRSPRPTNKPPVKSRPGPTQSQLMAASDRPGLGANTSGSFQNASFRTEPSRRDNSRNNLLQSMRSAQGLKPSVHLRKYSVGGMRYSSEKRQIAGMLMLFGLACVFQPLYSTATLIGTNGTTHLVGVDFAILFGDVCIILLGIMAVGIGLAEFVVESGDEKYTTALLLWVQTGFVWVISSMTSVGRIAVGSIGFIPEAYNPSVLINRFLGAMGIIAIASYGFAMIGSVAFMGFSLYAFQIMKPQERDRDYYVSRAAIYSGALFLAGLSQFLMGIFIIEVYGMTLESGPIQVGFFLINLPLVTTLIGVIQTASGLWGFLRAFGLFVKSRSDNRFQLAMGVVWVAQLILQCIVQSAYLPESKGAGFAASVAGLSFALNVMPFYLDYKVRMTLKRVKPAYFGLVDDDEIAVDNDAEIKISIRRKSSIAESPNPFKPRSGAVESA
ncbi:hypothetical protein MPSEU_000902400 [Mayamaea pseudoterrestris]|nr:hypothetical protein MPSEU_000902400 [Mayamaea pseudoterrestris]